MIATQDEDGLGHILDLLGLKGGYMGCSDSGGNLRRKRRHAIHTSSIDYR